MKRKTIKEFINESRIVHKDNYDYSLFNYESNYIKSIILCPTHGAFSQRPKDHLNGNGCPKCSKSG
jgi:hypothetical protein